MLRRLAIALLCLLLGSGVLHAQHAHHTPGTDADGQPALERALPVGARVRHPGPVAL